MGDKLLEIVAEAAPMTAIHTKNHKNVCYLCLESSISGLVSIGPKLHKRLIDLGLAVSIAFTVFKVITK